MFKYRIALLMEKYNVNDNHDNIACLLIILIIMFNSNN